MVKEARTLAIQVCVPQSRYAMFLHACVLGIIQQPCARKRHKCVLSTSALQLKHSPLHLVKPPSQTPPFASKAVPSFTLPDVPTCQDQAAILDTFRIPWP